MFNDLTLGWHKEEGVSLSKQQSDSVKCR
jgi:hypothetical protein